MTFLPNVLPPLLVHEDVHQPRNDEYWIPEGGQVADKDNPDAFLDLGVEIMPSARYRYEITGDQDHFIAAATAERLDDDPAIDQWQINETGILKAIVDDSKVN